MIEKVTSQANIQAMLQTMRSVQAQASAEANPAANAVGNVAGLDQRVKETGPSFSQAVKSAVDNVNELQLRTRELQSAYERGDNVPLTDVVLGMQKSSLAFEATLQIRNKVMRAYEDILNMPV